MNDNQEILRGLVNDRMQRRRQEADAERLGGCRQRFLSREWIRTLFTTAR
jgi:hypothetical protein